MEPHPTQIKQLGDLDSAKSFLVVMYSWWNGAGIDAAAWWIDESGQGYRRVLFTGETLDPMPPTVLADQVIDASTVESLIAEFCAMGGEGLTPQLDGIPMNQFDTWYGVKRAGERPATWIPVFTGYHDTERELDASLTVFFNRIVPEFRNAD